MKKFSVIMSALALATFGFVSCSDDDDDDNVDDVAIAGTYDLREVNTQNATDFNEDGTSNVNQALESDCYDDSRIVLNADNTFAYYNNYILVDEDLGTSACAESTLTGTWEIYAGSGSTVVLRATYEDENGDDHILTLNKEGDEITLFELFGQYPNRNDEGGAIYTSGQIEWIFER